MDRSMLSPDELSRLTAMSSHERRLKKRGFSYVAGVDEAGRGPLAGPVVAAACILPEGALIAHLNDSKKLTPERRESLYLEITTLAEVHYGIGEASVEEIEQHNILQATFLAMQRAVDALSLPADYLLIDGNRAPPFASPLELLVEGDTKSISIAAASILAKVTRDRYLFLCDEKWPHYGFKRHKGYATLEHLTALKQHGPCPIHRRFFEPIRQFFHLDSGRDLS